MVGPYLLALEDEVEGGGVLDHGVGVTLVDWEAPGSSSSASTSATLIWGLLQVLPMLLLLLLRAGPAWH